MTNYSAAVQRPFQDSKKFLVGSLLFMIPFVNIITGLFASGYILECARTAIKKQNKLPEWEDWGNLFVKGLLLSIVGMLYFLPALVLGIVSGFAALWAVLSGETQSGVILPIGVSLTASGLLAILTVYLVPSAILGYAHTNRFKSVFALSTVFRKAFRWHYFSAWVISVFYAFLISSAASVLSIALLSTVVGPFIIAGVASFVLGVTTITMMGQAYGETR